MPDTVWMVTGTILMQQVQCRKIYWREKNGEWYYYDANGHLVMNQEMDINGRHYKFTENGDQFIEDGIQMEQILTIMRQMEAVQKIPESR